MRSPRKDNRKGAAVVEFAVVSPIFVVLLLGMLEVGRGVSVQHSLHNAARAGCRVAIIDGATIQNITDQVQSGLAGTGISNYNVAVTPAAFAAAEDGDPITVTVSVVYDDVSFVPVPQYLAESTITASCSFPKE